MIFWAEKKEGYPFLPFLLPWDSFPSSLTIRSCCSIATLLYSTGFPALFGIFLRKHFGFMKWDTEAFRTMGLVHIYIYTYVRTLTRNTLAWQNCKGTVAATLNLSREWMRISFDSWDVRRTGRLMLVPEVRRIRSRYSIPSS